MTEGISNVYIDTILKGLNVKNFLGTFSSDTLPKQAVSMENFSLVTNLSRKTEKGTHFVAIIKRNHTLLYLDSLALSINLHQDILNFVTSIRNVETISTLKNACQNFNSVHCGFFCILFVLLFTYPAVANVCISFSKVLSKNDEMNDVVRKRLLQHCLEKCF